MDGTSIIPEKRYFTIGEASKLCEVKPHVLRYWEQEFPTLKPCKRRGNRRYYRREDVLLVRYIRALLYDKGYTIGGARQLLNSVKREIILAQTLPEVVSTTKRPKASQQSFSELVQELQDVLKELS